MQRIRSFLVFCLLLILVTGSLAFAGNQVTINALFMKQAGYSEEDIIKGTSEFEEANPGIKVNLTFVAYEELQQKILTSAHSGSYDVVLSDGPFTAQFAEAKIVKEIKLSDAEKRDIFPAVLEGCKYKGKLWGLPWLNDCRYLFYNKAMLKKAGIAAPPKTMDELLAQAKILKDQKIVEYPIVAAWTQAETLMCDFVPFAVIFGGNNLLDKEGNPAVNVPGNIKALDFMANSIKNGLVNPNSLEFAEAEVVNTFISGKAAFGFNWTFMYGAAKDPSSSTLNPDDVGIAVIPGQGKVVSGTCNGGQPLAISSGSKHPNEALKYIKYLCGKEFQEKYCANALPAWMSLFDDPQVIATGGPDVVKAAKVQYNYFVSRPMVPYWGELATYMEAKIQEVLMGRKTSVVALKECQDKALELAARK